MLAKESIEPLILRLSSNCSEIISRSVIREYSSINWGDNGTGSAFANRKFNYASIYANGKYKNYSENDDDKIPESKLATFLDACKTTGKSQGNGIIGIFIYSKRNSVHKRPIRKDILATIKKFPCVNCGSNSDMVCDHKNDVYNDELVLDTKTQVLDDFQSLCTHCNLQKRQIFKKESELLRIYSAKNIPQYRAFPFEFPWEKKIFDKKDVNCKRDTYWYDPVEFNNKIYCYSSFVLPVISEMKLKVRKNTIRLVL
jgi:uncharacterized protein YcfL